MMKEYSLLSKEELTAELKAVKADYDNIKELGLKLNMARGKPGKEQLDMVSEINDVLTSSSDYSTDNIDSRNYGNLDGLPSAKKLFADLLGTSAENVFVGGNASLQLMYDIISKAYTHGMKNSPLPWSKLDKVKWLCPVPGYDRHFKISESFGMDMINIPMSVAGPNMDIVEELIKDPEVKGMWCVPKYSNPGGVVFSDETVYRIASMKPAAQDFTLMWDNAYCVHEFDGEFVPFVDIISACENAGNPDMVYEFASTSKITFPGAGISCFATSVGNMNYIRKLTGIQTIGFDKVNQQRHVLYLKNKDNILALMKRHAAILAPKFKCVSDALNKEIQPLGIAEWSAPTGGYFISLNTLPGCAKRTYELCVNAGLVMTEAGATFPYGKDPNDSNMRIAPSYPPVDELEKAMKIYCICLRLAALEKLLK